MIILKANIFNLFVSSVLFVFWYHSPNVLDTPHICKISRLRVGGKYSRPAQYGCTVLLDLEGSEVLKWSLFGPLCE
jgi:hypothetical protein